jgi:hypothetical protein
MKKLVVVVVALSMLACGVALAQDVPSPDQDLGAFVSFLVDAFQGKQYALAGACVVMLLVFGVGKILPTENKWKPLLSAGFGVLLAIIVALAAGLGLVESIFGGLLVGTAASGLWSAVGKLVFKKKEDE